MPDNLRNREWPETEELESGAPGLPRPDLNPLVNPLLAQNMGRWAQVYFTSPPNQREHAVEKLLEELKAGSGSKKPASSEPIPMPEKTELPTVPDRPEIVSSGISVRSSGDDEPHLSDDPSQHTVVCPGCLHKNSAEQRFCGICGMALSREVAAPKSYAPSRTVQPSEHDENSESDWDWLRQRTLSSYEVQSETRDHSRPLFLLVLAFLVIAVAGFFLWHNRARFTHQQAPASSVALPESSAAPSMTIPMPATPTPAPVKSAKEKPQTNTSSRAIPKSVVQENANAPADDSSGTVPSDNGRDELDRARQYLAGAGVPKNSWMASQLLWKAIGKQNSDAVLLLSDLYAHGDGVPRSCEQARILLVSAAKKGSSAAAQKLRSIESGCR